MKERLLTTKIVEWYQEHHRVLPWRKTRDPYKIWLSEIILQQTRVAQGLPYYQEFIRRFPSVTALAAAPEREILRIWQGLGYYSRARNLRKCATEIVSHHGAKFPATFVELKKLPGIGDYTAAAIASFAFGEPVAVVDGNVFRVLARLFGIDDDILSTVGRKKFAALANRMVPKEHPGLFNQAMMEFGAMHCTPRNPKCDQCPLQKQCVAFSNDLQQVLPVKRKPEKPVHRHFYYFVLRRGNQWLMNERIHGDIWTGLFDFPLHEGKTGMNLRQLLTILKNSGGVSIRNKEKIIISPSYRHVLSHQVIHARFVEVPWQTGKASPSGKHFSNASWRTPREMAKLPKPVLISRFLSDRGVL